MSEFVAEILEAAGNQEPEVSPAGQQDLEAIEQRDYERDLSRHFSNRELHTILAAVGIALPSLNREQFRVKPLADLAKLASRLGARFKASAFRGPEGLALLGFYAKDRKLLRRPLICVNTAHHPGAVAAAFWHEIGHHLTASVFETRSDGVSLSLSAGYVEHLDDPMEVLADMQVCLVAYPKPVARRLFAESPGEGSGASRDLLTHQVLSRSRAHLRAITGFDFGDRIGTMENLHYLAGMIHFVKLRSALFARYEI